MIQIITDSASDIPKDRVESLNIEILPVWITHKEETFREYHDITIREYYNLLETSDEIPKTSQVSIDTFTQCYEECKNRGITKILYISINANGSGTFQSANIARDMFYDENGKEMEIEIIDSRTYSYIYGSIVVDCAKKAKAGVCFEEIVDYAKNKLETVEGYLGVFDLKFLKKSGRISGGSAFVGEALGLRPISYIGEGAVTVCEKVRGDANVYKKLVLKAKENCTKPQNQVVYIVHGLCSEEYLEIMEKQLLEEVGFKRVEKILLGAAITTNAGPKSVAIFYHK